ncbi:MAG: hypothetical protein AB7S26_02050 [Sandaracinaceae bacterium]
MTLPTTVGSLDVVVRGPDAAPAIRARDALEDAVRDALERVDRELGEEILVLRAIDLSLRARTSGRAPLDWNAELRRVVYAEVARAVHAARDSAQIHPAGIQHDHARFASEGVYWMEATLTEATSPDAWPFRGTVGPRAWERLAGRSRIAIGDALAHLARRTLEARGGDATPSPDAVARVAEVLSRLDAHRMLERWIASGVQAGAPDLDEVVPDAAWAEALVREARSRTAPPRALAAIAILLARWPAARRATVRHAGPRIAGATEGWRTEAAGLLLIARLAPSALAALDAAYPNPRARGAARWAVARSLAHAQVSSVDPVVLLFAGERPNARLDERALHDVDPEPLHRAALADLPDATLRLWRSGDITYAMSQDRCVDAVVSHDALTSLVRGYTERRGSAPGSVLELAEPPSEDVDRVMEVDVPGLPERWRAAVRALASRVRAELLERGVALAPLRRLVGAVRETDAPRRAICRLAERPSRDLARHVPCDVDLGWHVSLTLP